MPTFYRGNNPEDKTVYKDPALTQGFKTEDEFKAAGGIPDWGETASQTNIQALDKPAAITPDQFKPAESLKTVLETPDVTNYQSIIAGLVPPEQTEEEKASEASVKKTSTDITSLLGEQEGKGAYEAGLREEKGMGTQEKEIQNLTNQMRSLQMESQAQQLKAEDQNKEMVMGAVRGQQAAIQRDTAIKTLMLSSQLQAKQNNYALAQSQIERAVSLKFQPLEQKLEILKTQYSMNRDILERLDKVRADATATRLKQWEAQVAYAKEQEKDKNSIMLEASRGGAPDSVLSAILNANSSMEAIRYASGFLGAELKIQLQKMAFDQDLAQREYEESIRQADRKFAEDQRQFNKKIALDNWQTSITAANQKLAQAKFEMEKMGAGDPASAISPYQAERMVRNLQSVNDLRSRVNGWTVGRGSLLAYIPESDARNFKADLDTLKSNITFGELTAMREASKTGGALGQVSDVENRLLSAALGSLDTGQSQANFLKNLKQIEDSINRWKTAATSTGATNQAGQIIEYQGKKYKVDANGDMTPL